MSIEVFDYVKNIEQNEDLDNKKLNKKLDSWDDWEFSEFNLKIEQSFDKFLESDSFKKLLEKNADKDVLQDHFNTRLNKEYKNLDVMKEDKIYKKVVKKSEFQLQWFQKAEELNNYREKVVWKDEEKNEKETPNINKEKIKWEFDNVSPGDVSDWINKNNFDGADNVIGFLEKWDIKWLQSYIAPEWSKFYQDIETSLKENEENPLRSWVFNEETFEALKAFSQHNVEWYSADWRANSSYNEKFDENKDFLKVSNDKIVFEEIKKYLNWKYNFTLSEWNKDNIKLTKTELLYKWNNLEKEKFTIEVFEKENPAKLIKKIVFFVEVKESIEWSPEAIVSLWENSPGEDAKSAL
jgi:hypothetical protein